MVNESPRTNHNFVPPRRRSDRRGWFGGFVAVLLGIALLAGPPLLGAWANGSFDIPEPFRD